MTDSSPTWQALEIARSPDQPRPDYAPPLSKTIATIVYKTLHDYVCESVTYLSIPGVSRHRTFLRAEAPVLDAPSLPTVETDALTPGTQTLAAIAAETVAHDISLAVGTVETAPIGHTAAHTQRVLGRSATALESPAATPSVLEPLCDRLAGHPYAISIVANRVQGGRVELAIRVVDFTPAAQIATRQRLAERWPVSMGDVLNHSELLTNWTLLEEMGWCRSDVRSRGDFPLIIRQEEHIDTDEPTAAALAQTACDIEYAQLWPACPADPLAGHYNRYDVTGRLSVAPDQLPTAYPFVSQLYSSSVWDATDGRAPVRVTPVTTITDPEGLIATDTDPTAAVTATAAADVARCGSEPTQATTGAPTDTDTATAATAESMSAFERAVRRWCLERGEQIKATNRSWAAFLRSSSDVSRNAVYLIESPPVSPGSLIAAAWKAHHATDIHGLSVFAPTTECADPAATVLSRPFKSPSETTDATADADTACDTTPPTVTTLYRQPTPLRAESGVAVRSQATPTEQWQVTPDNELRCVVGETIVARGRLTAPLETFVDQTARVTATDDGRFKHLNADGTTAATYPDRETLWDEFTPIQAPARPAHLARGRETATVFVRTNHGFTDVRYPQSGSRVSTPDGAAVVRAFWRNFTVPDETATLDPKVVESELISFSRHQTDNPYLKIYWRKMQDQFTRDTGRPTYTSPIAGRRLRYLPPARLVHDE